MSAAQNASDIRSGKRRQRRRRTAYSGLKDVHHHHHQQQQQQLLPPLHPSPASLINSLIHLARSIISATAISPRRHNISAITRHVQTFLIFLEELRDHHHQHHQQHHQQHSTSSGLLPLQQQQQQQQQQPQEPTMPPSALLAFTELHVVLQAIKLMLQDCAGCSRMWLLIHHRKLSDSFHLLTQEMATAFDVLPLPLLDVSDEAREQLELVRRQARRSKPFIDPSDTELLACVQSTLAQIERKERPDAANLARLFSGLQLASAIDCRQEIERLEEERDVLSHGGSSPMWGADTAQNARIRSWSTKIPLNDVVSLVRYGKCVLYGATDIDEGLEEDEDDDDDDGGGGDDDEDSAGIRSDQNWDEGEQEEEERAFARVPEDFRCPITLEVMADPVIVATGQTYDRASITKWMVEEKNQTCPKSGLKLLHTALIPNHALRSLILQWSSRNNYPLRGGSGSNYQYASSPSSSASSSSSSPSNLRQGRGGAAAGSRQHNNSSCGASSSTALEAMKLTVELLLERLASADFLARRQIAGELRLLAKHGSESRKVMAEAGAIPALLPLLRAADRRTREHAITALLNLSIFPPNKARIVDAGGIELLIDVLIDADGNSSSSSSSSSNDPGCSEITTENAAATMLSLSQITEYAAMLGEDTKRILPGLARLLREGSLRGRRDAACALYNIAMYAPNRGKLVNAGAIAALLECLERPWRRTRTSSHEELALAVLAILANSPEGKEALCSSHGSSLRLLLGLIRSSPANQKMQENAAAIALQICRHGGYTMVAQISDEAALLHTLLCNGTPRAKRKAASLLRLIFRFQAQASDPITSTSAAAATHPVHQDTGAFSSMMLSYTTAAH